MYIPKKIKEFLAVKYQTRCVAKKRVSVCPKSRIVTLGKTRAIPINVYLFVNNMYKCNLYS